MTSDSCTKIRIKICGITLPEQAVAIAQLGISTLGFICVKPSPRYIEPSRIAQIVAVLDQDSDQDSSPERPMPQRIGVFAQADLETIQATVTEGRLSGVQLHGDESLEICQTVRAALPAVELIKAIRVRSPQDLDQAREFGAIVDTLLLDAYDPKLLGGTGHRIDWQWLREFRPACPWLLAGGLNPENIAEALSLLSPNGIDVSSGVECWDGTGKGRSPGNKDIDAVKRLVLAIGA